MVYGFNVRPIFFFKAMISIIFVDVAYKTLIHSNFPINARARN